MTPRSLGFAATLLIGLLSPLGCRAERAAPPSAFDELTAADTQAYLSKIMPPLIGRTLTEDELREIGRDEGAAIRAILGRIAQDPNLARAARTMMEEKLAVSGKAAEVEYSRPGNLVEVVVRDGRPWADILTSQDCYGDDLETVFCDAKTFFAAGVLTTRGYLKSRASRFNLTRASTMLRAFACLGYPQDEALEPKVDITTLKPMFAITDLEQASEEDLASAVNTGCACNDCHGQFAAHAQLFVRFDDEGLYHFEATGQQDPEGELGRSVDGLMASHFEPPAIAGSESSQLFGVPVANLSEAAVVLSEHPLFVRCTIQNILEHVLRLDTTVEGAVDEDVLTRIADSAAADGPPTFAKIVFELFTDPAVVEAVIAGARQEEP